MRGRSEWGHDDWMDTPFWKWTFRVLRWLSIPIAIIAFLFLLRWIWSFGPVVAVIIIVGIIYFIQRFRWAMHDSMG